MRLLGGSQHGRDDSEFGERCRDEKLPGVLRIPLGEGRFEVYLQRSYAGTSPDNPRSFMVEAGLSRQEAERLAADECDQPATIAWASATTR